ncbi:MAG TPA: class I SAM-dependent methyltransferase [Galbitalea sp.]
MTPHAGHGHDPHAHAHGGDSVALAELLDLGAEALHGTIAELTAWIAELMAEAPPSRILDLGAGTGSGTVALLERFPAATATELDSSHEMLHLAREKAARLGMADRVRILPADLDLDWPDAVPVDLIWASDSMHHAADPEATLRRAFDALRPGGLMAVIEPENFPRFLPDDVGFGRSGLEDRLHALVSHRRAATHPELGTDWGARLLDAGFTIAGHRRLDIDLTPPLDAAGRRYAQASLRRDRDRVLDELDPADQGVWRTLLDDQEPLSIGRRDDLGLRVTRSTWMSRRP